LEIKILIQNKAAMDNWRILYY